MGKKENKNFFGRVLSGAEVILRIASFRWFYEEAATATKKTDQESSDQEEDDFFKKLRNAPSVSADDQLERFFKNHN